MYYIVQVLACLFLAARDGFGDERRGRREKKEEEDDVSCEKKSKQQRKQKMMTTVGFEPTRFPTSDSKT
jgi:hypothetical protein